MTLRTVKPLVALIALALLARVLLAIFSVGSYDAILWRGFAERISSIGLIELYRVDPHFNHPPIAGWWAYLSLAIERATSLRFEFIFKLPMIASDAVVCWLLWKIWSTRRAASCAAGFVALYAWNLTALLLSAYHCNTDSVYAMLALLSFFLVEERRAHFLGGLALAAAINVKLIPIVLIIPMLGVYRDPRLAARFIAGLFIGAVPFLIPLIGAGSAFIHNVLDYSSAPTYWGINFFLRHLVRNPSTSGWAQPIMDHYHDLGRWIVLLAITLFTLVMRRRANDVSRYTACAACAAIFLILTPGFGMQYTVFAIPLMMAAAPRLATLHGAITGTGLILIYRLGWTGAWPLESTLGVLENAWPSTQLGLFAWVVLISFVVATLRSKPTPTSDR